MKSFLSLIVLVSSFTAYAAEVRLLPNQIEFDVNKNLEIKNAKLGVMCLRKASFFERLNNGLKDYMTCNDFKINGIEPQYSTPQISLKKIGKNKFALDATLITYSKSREGHVCLTVSTAFDEFGIPYENDLDSYSLLSYCTVKDLVFSTNDYVYNNKRVSTLEKFNDALGRPISVRLK